jgi:hypothetical protein
VLKVDREPAALDFFIEETLAAGKGFTPASGKTAADGKLRICDLIPGSYKLTAIRFGSDTTRPLSGSRPIEVTDRDVTNVELSASRGTSLNGTIAWVGERPELKTNPNVTVFLYPYDRTALQGETLSARLAAPGRFELPYLLSGSYAITATVNAPNVFVKDILFGGNSVRSDPVRVASGSGNPELQVLMGSDGGVIKVRIVDKDGKPAPSVPVAIAPAYASSPSALALDLEFGSTDEQGVFSSGALPPAKYQVLTASAPIDMSEDCINRLWRDRASKGKEVELKPRGEQEITAELQP